MENRAAQSRPVFYFREPESEKQTKRQALGHLPNKNLAAYFSETPKIGKAA